MNAIKKPLLLSLLSAFLLSFGWLGGSGFALLFAFVPLLILQNDGVRRLWLWVMVAFLMWIMATTWWVGKSTWIATLAIPLVGLCFSWLPFMIYHYFYKRASKALAYTMFVTLWLVFEKLYMVSDISFPWLTLGNGFAEDTMFIQWYSVTGVFGGSLWVLVSNLLYFELYSKMKRGELGTKAWLPAAVWIVVPVVVSTAMYYSYQEPKQGEVQVTVLQPNIDPYADKFKGMTQTQQLDLIIDLASKAPENTDYFVAPETAINDNFWINQASHLQRSVSAISNFLRSKYPKATMVIGATTYQDVNPKKGNDTTKYSVRTFKGSDLKYEAFNSCLWIDSAAKIDYYHKSKLVCGVETLPYPSIFKALTIDLGGVAGNMGRQQQRGVIEHGKTKTGTAICYESIYGEYFTDYIRSGAQLMFIITNDGWWGNTAGHRQHLNFARLRAIETRRSVARSANTGVSAFIDQRGDITDELQWNQRGDISSSMALNNAITPYVAWGDIITRLAGYTLALCALYYVAYRFRKKE